MKYCVTINNKRYEVEVERGKAAILSTTEVTLGVEENKGSADTQAAATTVSPKIVEEPEKVIDENTDSAKEVVRAPMAGGITDIKVNIGSRVAEGDVLLVLEAMKMENEIAAHTDGTVSAIKVNKGSNVAAGDMLVIIR